MGTLASGHDRTQLQELDGRGVWCCCEEILLAPLHNCSSRSRSIHPNAQACVPGIVRPGITLVPPSGKGNRKADGAVMFATL